MFSQKSGKGSWCWPCPLRYAEDGQTVDDSRQLHPHAPRTRPCVHPGQSSCLHRGSPLGLGARALNCALPQTHVSLACFGAFIPFKPSLNFPVLVAHTPNPRPRVSWLPFCQRLNTKTQLLSLIRSYALEFKRHLVFLSRWEHHQELVGSFPRPPIY